MAEVLRQLANGKTIRFDDAQTAPEVIDRVVNYENAKFANANDTTGGVVDKSIRTVVRGTGEGIAQTADLPHVGGHWLGQVMKNAWEEAHGRDYTRTASDWPLTDVYNKNVAAPVEPGYERMNDITAMLAPAVIESAVTLGAGAPAAIATMGARTGVRGAVQSAKQLAGAGARTGARAATTTGLGVGGGTVGGEVGEYVGGDVGRELGSFAGSLAAFPAANAYKSAVKSRYFDPDSADTLNAINRLNMPSAEGGADAGIPVTAGILSPKRLGAKEDQLARQPIIGRKVIETRRGQYSGIDEAKKNVIEQIRGREAGGPITKESLGNDIRAMLADAETTVDVKMSNLQEALAQNVGLLTPTDAMHIEGTLGKLAKERGTSDALRSQADRLRAQIRKDYDLNITDTGVPTPTMPYGAAKDIRSNIGAQLPDEGLARKVEAPTYGSLTEMMREAAEQRGITNFDDIQTRYSNWKTQKDAITEMRGKSTDPEAGAYSSLVGGGSKGSIKQLKPFEEHSPAALDQILADALELHTRGPNAGRPVDPELVDPKAMVREWGSRSDEFKDFYTKNNPTLRKLLDDITTVSQAEASRAGKRSVPGGPGSTIGEGQDPKPGLAALLAERIGGPALSVLSLGAVPAVRAVKSKLLTSEPHLQRLFQKEPLGTSAVRGAAGAATADQFRRLNRGQN